MLLLLAIEVGGWSLVSYPRVRSAMIEGANPVAQVGYVLASPLQFVWLLANDLWTNGALYLQTWIADFGYRLWSIPLPTFIFFGFAIVASLFIPSATKDPTRYTRLGLAAVFVASYLFTASVFYVAFNPVAAQTLSGIHGRHLLGTMAVMALAFVGLVSPFQTNWTRWAVVGAIAGLLFFVGGAVLSYHVACGSQFFQRGLCYQPYYKNWAPNENLSRPLNASLELSQEIIPECQGMTEVRVWMGAAPETSGAITFSIVDTSRSVLLAKKTVANTVLLEAGWQRLEFDPEWDSEGRLYLLSLRGEQEGLGPQVGLTIRPENPIVRFWANGEESDVDLFFQYGCLAGLERVLR